MKRFIIAALAAIVASFPAQAGYETGAADQVLRVPGAGGRPTFGQVDLSKTAATKNQLPTSRGGLGFDASSSSGVLQCTTGSCSASTISVTNGGTGNATNTANNFMIGNGTSAVTFLAPGSAGNFIKSNGTNAVSIASQDPTFRWNIGFSDSVGSSNWTVAITQADGSTNCSASAPCMVAFRSGTATSSAINIRSITGALSQVITSGTTLGMFSGSSTPVYIYLLDSDGAGTIKVGLSTNLWPEDRLLPTTVAESFSTSCTQASPTVCTSTNNGLDVGGQNAVKFTGTISGLSTDCTAQVCYTINVGANVFGLRPAIGSPAINKTSGGTQTPVVHMQDGSMVTDGVYTNVPIRLIGSVKISEATAGTWASAATVRSTVVANANVRPARTMMVNSTCSASPCTISDLTDMWVEQVIRSATGVYTVYFPPNIFLNAPICTCTSMLQADSSCEVDSTAVSSINVSTITASTGAAINGRWALSCWEVR